MSAVAFFISAHGLGHAARAAAVMQALHDRRPHLRCEIFSAAPAWFFHESLTGPWRYHALAVDVGLVQVDSLHEDMPATLAALDAFYPLDAGLVQALARQIVALGCELVLCDIAPLGIAVAAAAGLPSVLIENFTWEWIYAGLEEAYPDLRRHRCYLAQLFAAADHRIQAEPVCVAQAGAFTTPPIARRPRQTRTEIRQRLGVAANAPLVLLTMGGAAWEYAFLPRLTTAQPDIQFLIPGSVSQVERWWPTKSSTVSTSVPGNRRRPRPSCCRNSVADSVGRRKSTLLMAGMSTPSLRMSETKPHSSGSSGSA
ncbi:MAG: hypothetical protein HUU23_15365, partial [Caldilineales bacterium]|nr:hypothetical protein [Caldilineales bacterium]